MNFPRIQQPKLILAPETSTYTYGWPGTGRLNEIQGKSEKKKNGCYNRPYYTLGPNKFEFTGL
jgi:hypothetical protein